MMYQFRQNLIMSAKVIGRTINEWSKLPLSFKLASEKWYETLTIIMMIPFVMKTLTVAVACILGTEMVKNQ